MAVLLKCSGRYWRSSRGRTTSALLGGSFPWHQSSATGDQGRGNTFGGQYGVKAQNIYDPCLAHSTHEAGTKEPSSIKLGDGYANSSMSGCIPDWYWLGPYDAAHGPWDLWRDSGIDPRTVQCLNDLREEWNPWMRWKTYRKGYNIEAD